MPLQRHPIDWSSARVEAIGEFYELQVRLGAEEPSGRWTDALNNEATRRYKAARGQKWGAISVWDNTLVVHELEEGAEEALQDYLRDLFETADRIADAGKKVREGQSEAEAAQGRQETAESMTAAFRMIP